MAGKMTYKPSDHIAEINKGPAFGKRHIQLILIFILEVLMYITRFSFSVALVAMTQRSTPNPDVPVYNWHEKGILLSSFFWGYVIPQIPIGIVGTKFGTKNFILGAAFLNSLFSMLIPTMANKLGIEGVAVCRVIQGLSQGLIIPSVHGLLGKWAPTNERTRMYGVVCVGYAVGNIIGLSVTGYLCSTWSGWPLSFYLLPSLGFVWVIFYYLYGAPSPAAHKTITYEERVYIESSLGSQNTRNVAIPFKAIFTSIPFWSDLFMSLCSGWGFSLFTTELPIYMDKIMKFTISSNGIFSALPYVCDMCATMSISCLADYLISNNYLSVGTTRKTMSAIGSLGAATLLVIFCYMPISYRSVSVGIIMLAAAFRSMNVAGYNVNHLDLSPNFGLALMGMKNTAGELFSIITPISIQYIVYDESNQFLWQKVFLTAVCLYIISTATYVTFASGERQWWNFVKEVPKDEERDYPLHEIELEHLK